ncbi:MAG: YbaB/EbfC family nucleoid-associated protein [Actinomycetota bacterium]|nr:YbaB/EbfC family nucleoid-associated protein [Actinomycetota bacterium]
MSEPQASEQFDMGALLEQAQAVQQQLLEAQAAAAEQVAEAQSGGGAVKIRITGGMEFKSVSIDPQAVDPGDVSMLEDLILVACNEAVARAQELTQEAVGALDLGELGGLDAGH